MRPITEQVVNEIALCRSKGLISSRIFISFSDLQTLMKEEGNDDWREQGLFYGLTITLHQEGLPPIVLPPANDSH